MTTLENKVTTQHLQRSAYLYVRQSTLRQVLENTESTQRQYALVRPVENQQRLPVLDLQPRPLQCGRQKFIFAVKVPVQSVGVSLQTPVAFPIIEFGRRGLPGHRFKSRQARDDS